MNNAELIFGGLKLMVFGMGMVFVFLVVMIYAMNLLQKLLEPFKGMLEPVKAPVKAKKSSGDDGALAAAAATAVELFRNK